MSRSIEVVEYAPPRLLRWRQEDSNGGSPSHPAWYLNLLADPRASVEVEGERRQVVARTVTGEERARLWPRAVEIYPAYASYQRRTDRELPVVVLEPAQER